MNTRNTEIMENKRKSNYLLCILLVQTAILVAQIAVIKTNCGILELLTAIAR